MEKKRFNDINSSKAYTILMFAGVFALFLVFLCYKNNILPVSIEPTQRSFAYVKIPELNSTIVGRLSRNKGDYFLGISYAKPVERFKVSTLATIKRDSTLYYIHYHNGCPNGFLYMVADFHRIVPEENSCQTLNIYRCNVFKKSVKKPTTNSEQDEKNLAPVLIYLNEGKWYTRSDSAVLHPASVIDNVACNGNTIVVSIQYRMGPYGFFSTQAAQKVFKQPKNLALEDVRAGILWVHKNIEYFGGDVSRITVMGKGIGAQIASVLSSTTNNPLFQQLVLLSGSSYVPTLYTQNYGAETTPITGKFDASLRYAIAANCTNEKEWEKINELQMRQTNQSKIALNTIAKYYEKVEQCVKKMKTEKVELALNKMTVETFVSWPLIGGLSQNASENTSSIPTIIGTCRQKISAKNTVNKLDKESFKILQKRLSKVGDLHELGYAKEIISHYTEEFPSENNINETMRNIKQDFVVNGPILLEAYYRSFFGSAPVYFFEYESSKDLKRSQVDIAIKANKFAIFPNPDLQQVCLDDLLFNPLKTMEFLSERHIGKTFAELLTNFLHDGEPTSSNKQSVNQLSSENIFQWPLFLPKNAKYLLDPMYDHHSNKVLKFDAIQGVHIANYQSQSNESRRFWLCNMAKKLRLKQAFCNAQSVSQS